MKNNFKSFWALKLEEYIDYRKTLGFKDQGLKNNLRNLDQHLSMIDGKKNFSPTFFLEFRKSLKGSPKTRNNILSKARGFFDYMVRNEYLEQNPIQDIPSYKENSFIPFIFSMEETDLLLEAIKKRIRHDSKYFFNDMIVYTAVVLLTRCGMRISEPLKLQFENYRRDDRTIYIEKTKFNKDRLIPFPKKILNDLNNYTALRKAFLSEKNFYFFPGRGNKGISKNRIYSVFHKAVKDIGINESRRAIDNMTFGGPTPHSLRHSFAVNTLKQIKNRGKSVQHALPVLSSYLGHSKYRYTAVYLKLLDAKHRRHLVDFSISKQGEL